MKHKAFCFVVALIVIGFVWAVLFPGPVGARDEQTPTERWIHEEWDRLPLHELDSFLRQLDPDVRNHLPPVNYRSLVAEGGGVTWSAVGQGLFDLFLYEVRANVWLLKQLLALGLFSAILHVTAVSFSRSDISDVALLVAVFVLLLIAFQVFQGIISVASETIAQMVSLLHALLPVMSMMLAAVGAVTTAAVYHPLVYVTVTAVATIVENWLIPAVFISTVLSVIGSVTPEFRLKKLEGLIKTGSLILLSLLFVGFVAIVQMRGIVTPVADGLAVRTAKFLTSTFIPVVGSRISDALDVIIGGSVLIKNAVGFFGMLTIALMTLFPVVKILTLFVIFKVAAAVIEPVTDERLVGAMSGMAGGIALVAAGVITTALMFFVGMMVIVSVGNTAAFMR